MQNNNGKIIVFLVFLSLFLGSCGSSSSGTSAGDYEDQIIIIWEELFEGSGSSGGSGHPKTGFYKTLDYEYGFENNISSDHDGESHVSYDQSEDGYVEWVAKWDVREFDKWDEDEKIDMTIKYFICDPEKENLDNANADLISIGIDDDYDCEIATEELEEEEKLCGRINVRKYYERGFKKIGICEQWADGDGAPSLLATLSLHPYEKKENEIFYTTASGEVSSDYIGNFSNSTSGYNWTNLKNRANDIFRRAVAAVDFKDAKYSREKVDPGYSFSNIENRNNYLFIAPASQNAPPSEDCYMTLMDDVDILESYVEEMELNDEDKRRFIAVIDKQPVAYWTFRYSDRKPCLSDYMMFSTPKTKGDVVYNVGVLNSSEVNDCGSEYSEENRRQLQMRFHDGTWEIRDASLSWNMGEWTTDLSIIRPECEVLYRLNEDIKKEDLMQRHIPTKPTPSLVVTKLLNPGKLVLFYTDTETRYVSHEIAHLLGLSDVQKEGNLMNYESKKSGDILQYSALKARKDDYSPFDKNEYQWDCFHDKSRCAYP
ncbi:MAG: hypothetical protein J6T62_01085 [Fibrobacter sp.]|nr:hypothetical protein [Fibrobacter sp.]